MSDDTNFDGKIGEELDEHEKRVAKATRLTIIMSMLSEKVGVA